MKMVKMNKEDYTFSKEKFQNYAVSFYKAKDILNDLLASENIVVDINQDILVVILKEYKKNLNCLRKVMKEHRDDRVDSHKIVALFTMLIVKHNKVITIPKGMNQKSTFQTIPYIYFAYIYSIVVMEIMYNIDKEEKVIFNTNINYLKEFVKLIYANRNIITIPVTMPKCEKAFNGIFLLSHLYYFVEEVADKQPDI